MSEANPSLGQSQRSTGITSGMSSTIGRPSRVRISRIQLLDYLHQRHWWRIAQYNLVFTLVLWGAFIAQIYLRASVEAAYQVKSGIQQHIQRIESHPSLSGYNYLEPEEVEVPCRCACRSAAKGTPTDVCDAAEAEILTFSAEISTTDKATLLSTACSDTEKPLAAFVDYVSEEIANYSCSEWADLYGTSNFCSVSSWKAYLENVATTEDLMNDTDSLFFYEYDDFTLPRWLCPSTCGACLHDPAHGATVLTWDKLDSIDEVWLWLEHGLLPDVFAGETSNKDTSQSGILNKKNLVIGGLRARQTRAVPGQECDVPANLQQVYTPSCRSLTYATSYTQPNLTEHRQDKLGDMLSDFYGAYAAVEGDSEGAFDAYFEVEKDYDDAMVLAGELRRVGWVDASTRSLTVEALAINAEVGFFALVRMTFSLSFDGIVNRRLEVQMMQVISEFAWIDYIPEFIWLFLILSLLLQELWQVLKAAYHRKLHDYFADGWNVVDWISILTGGGVIAVWLLVIQGSSSLTSTVVTLPRSPLPNTLNSEEYRTAWTGLLQDATDLYQLREIHWFLLFAYSTIITLRFLKGFLGQQKLAMIQYAMARSTTDVFHFQIVFVIMFVTFVIGGHVLFGAALEEWSTVGNSLSSAIKMLMGAFDFENMYDYAPFSATAWFWLFLLTMVFLLMKLLTAMLVYHFAKFRRIVGPTESIFVDAWNGFRDLIWRLEWRWDYIRMWDFLAAFQNPYEDLMDGVMTKANIRPEMAEMMEKSVLGLRLAQAKRDVVSMDGLAVEMQNHPAIEVLKAKEMQKELRKIAADPATADHLIDECDKQHKKHLLWARKIQHLDVEKARGFLSMLRSQRDQLNTYCDQIENGFAEEMSGLIDGLEGLEVSIAEAFEGLLELRSTEVDSLALCPPRLPYAGTSLRNEYEGILAREPPRAGTMAVPGRGGLRDTADPVISAIADRPGEWTRLGIGDAIPEVGFTNDQIALEDAFQGALGHRQSGQGQTLALPESFAPGSFGDTQNELLNDNSINRNSGSNQCNNSSPSHRTGGVSFKPESGNASSSLAGTQNLPGEAPDPDPHPAPAAGDLGKSSELGAASDGKPNDNDDDNNNQNEGDQQGSPPDDQGTDR